VDVTKLELQFKTEEERDYFIGQLFDGLCENAFDSRWVGEGRDVVSVKPIGEYWEHHKKMNRKYKRAK
jgi:hypothetical protein